MTLFTQHFNRMTFQRVLILLFMAVAIAPAAYADDVDDGARAAPEPLRAARPTFEIGPVDGLTTDWHPAPAWTSIPAGTILMLHQAAQLDEMVVWSGAYEFARDESGSTAIAILHVVGPQQISVQVAPHQPDTRQAFSSSSTFDVVNIRFDYISVSPIVVDLDPPTNDSGPDVVEPTGFEEPSDLQEFTDDQSAFEGSGGSGLVLLEVDVNPPGFAPLMEWRLDDQPAILGPAVLMRSADMELSMVEVGPVSAPSTLQGSSETASANAPSVFASNRIAAPHGGSSPSPQPASRDDDKRSNRDLPNDPAEAGDGGDDSFWASDNETDIYNINSGNVGIGTMEPDVRLQVVHDLGVDMAGDKAIAEIRRGGPGEGLAGLQFGYVADGQRSRMAYLKSLNGRILRLGTSGTPEAVAITNSGNVGIGTTNPSFKLAVENTANDASIIVGKSGATDGILVADESMHIVIDNDNTQTDRFFAFDTNGYGSAELMRITEGGNVGIGTTGPSRTLQVRSITPDQNLVLFDSASPGSAHTVLKVGHTQTGIAGINMLEVATDTDGDAGGETTRFVIRNDGNVGIGVQDPFFNLDVRSSADTTTIYVAGATTPRVRLQAGGRDGWIEGERAPEDWFALKFFAENSQGSIEERMRITGDGNVGIGTTEPSYKLAVENTANDASIIIGKSAATDGILVADESMHFVVDNDNTQTDRFFAFDANGYNSAELMRITEGGLVGIGTTTPAAKLDIKNNGEQLYLQQSNVDNGWKLTVDNADGALGFIRRGEGEPPTDNEHVTITTGGNVGIGTTTPADALHVNGRIRATTDVEGVTDLLVLEHIPPPDGNDGGTQWGINFQRGLDSWGSIRMLRAGNSASQLIFATRGSADGLNERLWITSTGRVGIGTNNPNESLQVIGNVRANAFLLNSDARFKKNVEPMAGSLSKVLKLRGVEFDWKRDEFPDYRFSDQRQIGFIAQEIMNVLPSVVSEGNDGSYSVAYGGITPVLVEAIKELHQTVEDRDVLIAAQGQQIEDLMARLDRMEMMMARLPDAEVRGAE